MPNPRRSSNARRRRHGPCEMARPARQPRSDRATSRRDRGGGAPAGALCRFSRPRYAGRTVRDDRAACRPCLAPAPRHIRPGRRNRPGFGGLRLSPLRCRLARDRRRRHLYLKADEANGRSFLRPQQGLCGGTGGGRKRTPGAGFGAQCLWRGDPRRGPACAGPGAFYARLRGRARSPRPRRPSGRPYRLPRTLGGAAMTPPPFSRPVRVEAIPRDGLETRIEADAGERAALAAFNGLPAVAALGAAFSLKHGGGGTILVRGELSAEVTQTCVVTLEPFEASISAP